MSAPPATRAAHRDERQKRQRLLLGGIIALIVVLVGAIGFVGYQIVAGSSSPGTPQVAADPVEFPDDEPAAQAGDEPCIEVGVLSSFENAELIENLAAAYNAQPRDIEGSCVTVTAAKDKSGIAAETVAESFDGIPEDERPAVWVPDADSWLAVATDLGANLPEDPTSIAVSDIVLAMPEPLAAASGWDEDAPSWSDVFEVADDPDVWTDLGHPEWGPFKLGKTSPVIASSGAAAMYASYGSAAGSVAALDLSQVENPDVVATVKAHELATSHYMATPEHFLWHARQAEQSGSASDFLSAVIVDEKSVWDYNRGITSRDGVTRTETAPPTEKLVPIYPTDGFYVADNPAVVLEGDWVTDADAAAAADFLRFATTAQGQQVVRESGYRDLNGVFDDDVLAVGMLDPEPVGVLPFPTADVVVAVNDTFPDVRKRADVLFLVDLSGSMDDEIGNDLTKLEGAKNAIELALDHFTAGDGVGLAGFASTGDGEFLPGTVSEIADIADSREDFVGALNELETLGYTPLYQAVDQYAAERSAAYQPDRINAVVVLSDGQNHTQTPTIDDEEMLANLAALNEDGPVLVFTLAYGAEADVETLQAISGATGAHFYDATDPTEVEAVLGELVTSF